MEILIMKSLLRCFAFVVAVLSVSFSVYAVNPPAPPPPMKAAAQSNAVNINTATAQTITDAKIKGIGKKRAEAIVAYRTQHGPFKSIDDLKNIKGLSQKVIDANRARLTVG